MAQNELDALRYSQTQLYGNARSAGYGNANGAIGADFGGLSYNPAGIGLYRKNEFVFSPSLKINATKGDLGKSYLTRQPVTKMIKDNMMPTIQLSIGGLIFGVFSLKIVGQSWGQQ